MNHLFQSFIQYKVFIWVFVLLFAGYGSLMPGKLTTQNIDAVDFHGLPSGGFQNTVLFETDTVLSDSSKDDTANIDGMHTHRTSTALEISIESGDGLGWGEISKVVP